MREIDQLSNAREPKPRSAREVTCPDCAAAPQQPCLNPLTGQTYRHEAPHIARIVAARGGAL